VGYGSSFVSPLLKSVCEITAVELNNRVITVLAQTGVLCFSVIMA